MKNRRGFLAALSAVSGTALGLVAAAKSDARPTPPPTPRASPAPSAAALAIAATFRAFDPHLTEDELRKIARTIDDNRTGAVLDPKKKPLRNSDEPVVRFSAQNARG
jgi:hypothetical protein